MYTTSAVVTQFSANTKKQQKQTAKEIIAANGQALSFQFMTEAKRRSFLLLAGNLMRGL